MIPPKRLATGPDDTDPVDSCEVCGRPLVSGAGRCPACDDYQAVRPPLEYV